MAYVVTGYWNAGYTVSDSEAALTAQLQKIAPGAIVELFQLELNVTQHGVAQTYYFHSGVDGSLADIAWDGQTYQALPIQVEGFEWNGQGSLPRPKLQASNALGTITALILTLPSGLEGAKVTRIRTLGRYLDGESTADVYSKFPDEVYYCDRLLTENRDVIAYELASAFDLAGVRAPKRQCVTRCQWVYRSAECSYAGSDYFDVNNNPVVTLSEDVCGKKVDSCKARFGDDARLPFGGYPGIGTFFA